MIDSEERFLSGSETASDASESSGKSDGQPAHKRFDDPAKMILGNQFI
jgi:hypothetical protein